MAGEIDGELGKKIEIQLKKEIENEVKAEIEEKLDKKLDKKLEKELEKDIQKEVRERLAQRLYEITKKSAFKFKTEFREHSMTGITAAFAFLIALSWRTPIQDSIDILIEKLGLVTKAIYVEFLSAILITIIAVLVLMWVSHDNPPPSATVKIM